MLVFMRLLGIPIVTAGMLLTAPALAGSGDDLKALQREVGVLRQNQAQIQRDLDEIKKLLVPGSYLLAPEVAAFQPADLNVGRSPALGSATAPVTLVAFIDYECPFCKRHVYTVMPDIKRQYVDTGKVRFVIREFPVENIHAQALSASSAALCAREQGQYWAMHDLLFADQQNLPSTDLTAHAQTLGLDSAAFGTCLSEGRYMAEIRASQAEGQKLGIDGTPGFVLGLTDGTDPDTVHLSKYIRGAQPLETFAAAIDELLQAAVH